MSQPHERSTVVAPPLDSSKDLLPPSASTNLPGLTTTRFQSIGSSDLIPGATTTMTPGRPQRTDSSASTSPKITSTSLETGSIANLSTGLEQQLGTSSSTEPASTESSFGPTSVTETIGSSTETDDTTSTSSSSSSSSSSTSSSSTSSSSTSSSSTSSSSTSSSSTSSSSTSTSSSTSSSSSSSSTSAAATPECVPGLDYSAAVYDLANGQNPAHPVCAELLRTFHASDANAMNLALVIENRVPLHTGRTPQGDGSSPILRTLWVDETNWDKPYSIYDYTAPPGKTSRYTCLVVMHRGYIRFPAAGRYDFTLISPESTIGEVDDNLYLWMGDTTPSGNFSPSNSILRKLFQSEGNARKNTYYIASTADELVPIRVFYANRLGPGRFRVDITGPSTPSLLSCTGEDLDDWIPWKDERVFVEQAEPV